MQRTTLLILLSVLSSLAACTQHHSLVVPENPSQKLYGTPDEAGDSFRHGEAPTTVFTQDLDCTGYLNSGAPVNYWADQPIHTFLNQHTSVSARHKPPLAISGLKSLSRPSRLGLPLSPGDLVELFIENGEGFNGKYVVDSNGELTIPFLKPISVAGEAIEKVEEQIELGLVRDQIFLPTNNLVSLKVLHWAEIEVSVSGAVFQPGRVKINSKRPEQVIDQRINASGDHSSTRMLSEALRAAAGIRPDAKLDQVLLIRDGWHVELDMMGIFTGERADDIPLVAGDLVVVPSTGCFQQHLVRPTQITPKGFRVFMSNLIESAGNNSAAAIGRFSSNIPYGSRLLHAVVSANCVGGTQLTDAPKKVVLASRNPLTGQTQVMEQSIELIMRQAHLDRINPYLMPNDAIACYDSDVTNLREAAKALTDIINPFNL